MTGRNPNAVTIYKLTKVCHCLLNRSNVSQASLELNSSYIIMLIQMWYIPDLRMYISIDVKNVLLSPTWKQNDNV